MLNGQHIDNQSVKQENKKPTLLLKCRDLWKVIVLGKRKEYRKIDGWKEHLFKTGQIVYEKKFVD